MCGLLGFGLLKFRVWAFWGLNSGLSKPQQSLHENETGIALQHLLRQDQEHKRPTVQNRVCRNGLGVEDTFNTSWFSRYKQESTQCRGLND